MGSLLSFLILICSNLLNVGIPQDDSAASEFFSTHASEGEVTGRGSGGCGMAAHDAPNGGVSSVRECVEDDTDDASSGVNTDGKRERRDH